MASIAKQPISTELKGTRSMSSSKTLESKGEYCTISSGTKERVWIPTMGKQQIPTFKPLTENITEPVDCCVVGAGISGLSVAYNLCQAGKSVVILEDGEILSGETGRTTAHLGSALDDRWYNIKSMHGKELAVIAAKSHSAAIDSIEKISQEEGIDCDFRRVDAYLFYKHPRDDRKHYSEKEIKQEMEAVKELGIFPDSELLERAPGIKGVDTGLTIRFPNQGEFHPVKYLAKLAEILNSRGPKPDSTILGADKTGECKAEGKGSNPGRCTIYTKSKMVDCDRGDILKVKTANGNFVMARNMVLATNIPVLNKIELIDRNEPYRSYVIAAKISKGIVPHALWWDTEDPYHYVRLQSDPEDQEHDWIIIGGEDHVVGREEEGGDRYKKLEDWARERWPEMKQVQYQWSGQVLEPVDYLGFIGKNPLDSKNVFVVTGDSGNGITNGALAGLLIRDLILGKANPWEALYHPDRRRAKSLPDMAKHLVEADAYYARWLKGSDVKDIEDLAPCRGALVNQGLHKLAVYKDAEGGVHKCYAMCPHLGGIVKWNDDEKSWDCPVHGSRFDPYGHVINGPSCGNLKPAGPELESDKEHQKAA